jgi:tetratricopeptide (TPR) repeat protein
MKKFIGLAVIVFGLAGCATVAPPNAGLYIEPPTRSYSTNLTLDERIAVEDAWSYLKAGNMDKAQKALLKLDPKNPYYPTGFGYIAFLNNELSNAEAFFLSAVHDFPDFPLAYLALGELYEVTGKTDLAYTHFLEVLKREPDNAYAGKEVETIRGLKTEEYLTEAKSAEAAGDTAKGKDAYLKALEYSPKLEAAHLGLARLYLKDKDFQKALLHLRSLSQNDPKNRILLGEYADALYQTGQLSRSLDAYAKLLDLDPKNKTARDRSDAIKAKLGVVDLPSEYNDIASLPAVAREDVAALIGVRFKDLLDEPAPRTPVIVDITTSWALQHIVKVASFEIMGLNANRTFEPRKPVTRAEMAETLVRLAAFLKKHNIRIIEQIPADRIRIADVPNEHFFHQPIVQAISYQLLDLYPDRTFKPDQVVSGKEATKALDILLGLSKS